MFRSAPCTMLLSRVPVGALEITEAGTRFIPFVDPARLGIALIVGFLIGLTIGRGPGQRRSVMPGFTDSPVEREGFEPLVPP